jgi:putative tryptophan/tyrosine transport system substrate-binding protein
MLHSSTGDWLMDRRRFIASVAAAQFAALPTSRAQQSSRVRRIGVLIPFAENDELWQGYLVTFRQRLKDLGWIDGRNVRIDYRFTGGNAERIRIAAEELVATQPDVVFVASNPAVSALMKATRSVPIVFIFVSDSVNSGFVASLGRPGGNATGFQNVDPLVAGKWIGLLKQIAPGLRRAAVVHVPEIAANVAFLHAAQAASASLGMTVTAAGVRDGPDIERALAAFAQEPKGGLIVTPNPVTSTNRELIIALAARLGLPAIYPYGWFPTNGGLVSYGLNRTEHARESASYVDRILHGADPGVLPVQLPTKYELVINIKTAKALGLTVPQSLLVGADEVIQ